MENKFMILKSGTDIRGIAVEGVPNEHITLTDEIIEKIALSFAHWISDKKSKKYNDLHVAIGHDSRVSANRIKKQLIDTLSSVGINIFDCGLSSTPAMFMSTIDLSCDASIEITASHHPFNRNGLKFFTRDGGLDSCDIEDILNYANKSDIKVSTNKKGTVEKVNYMETYAKRLRKIICNGINCTEQEKPLSGFKIIVDAGNGAGGFYAKDVLLPLGADITGSQFLNPDGYFPNHIPNPENRVAMQSIVEATIKNNADLGLIFDTDVDRASAVDNKGNEICRNSLIALASEIALEGNENGTIVTDSITSDGLHEYIEEVLHGVHNRFKRGYKNVINEAKRLNLQGINCPLAIETSGHAAMRENYFLDDGAYLVTKIIIKMVNLKKQGQNLGNILNKLKKPEESLEFRLNIINSDFKTYGEDIIDDLYSYAQKNDDWHIAPDNKEGIRVSFDENNGDGWFLLRLSVHDPVMPLNIESNKIGGAKVILNKFKKFIKDYEGLDLKSLEEGIK